MTTVEQIHRQATTEDISVVCQVLQQSLGQRLAAYGAQIKDPKQVGRFAKEDGPKPGTKAEGRLREIYKVVQLLLTRESAGTVRAWMIGSNPQLNDEAPIEVLHHDEPGRVIRAAEAFVNGG